MWNRIFPTNVRGEDNELTPRFDIQNNPQQRHNLRELIASNSAGSARKYQVGADTSSLLHDSPNQSRALAQLDYSSSSIRPGSPSGGPFYLLHGGGANGKNAPSPQPTSRGGKRLVPLGRLHADESQPSPGYEHLEASLRRIVERLGPGMELTEKWDLLAQWVDRYFDTTDCNRLASVTMALHKHVVKATAGRDQPDGLRTSLCFMLFEQVMHLVALSQPSLREPSLFLRNELLQAIYMSPPLPQSLDQTFFPLDSARDAEGQAELIRRFYGTTYFHAVREWCARGAGADRLSAERAERVKHKTMRVLTRLTAQFNRRVKRLCWLVWSLQHEAVIVRREWEQKLQRAEQAFADKDRDYRQVKQNAEKHVAQLTRELQEARQGLLGKDRILSVENENIQLKREVEMLKREEVLITAPLRSTIEELEQTVAIQQGQLDLSAAKLDHLVVIERQFEEVKERAAALERRIEASKEHEREIAAMCKEIEKECRLILPSPPTTTATTVVIDSRDSMCAWLNTFVGSVQDGRYAVTLDLGISQNILDPCLVAVHLLGITPTVPPLTSMTPLEKMKTLITNLGLDRWKPPQASGASLDTFAASMLARSEDTHFQLAIVSLLHAKSLVVEKERAEAATQGVPFPLSSSSSSSSSVVDTIRRVKEGVMGKLKISDYIESTSVELLTCLCAS
eukprot:PhM_4_TR6325/c0_g1_i1/m.78974